jgi:hypothetical protein
MEGHLCLCTGAGARIVSTMSNTVANLADEVQQAASNDEGGRGSEADEMHAKAASGGK